MSNEIDIYDTNVLIQTVPNLKTSQNFLLDLFFPNIVTSDTEFVSIDVDVGRRRMAPFVSPLVKGKTVESRRVQTNVFKPAYVKPLTAPDLRRPIRRQIGERIGGEFTAAERAMLNLQFEIADHIDMINRRMEWMASSALTTGSVTVKGEGFETVVIDFGRSPSLSVALTGADKWPTEIAIGQTNNKPTQDIEEWQTRVLKESGGVVTDLVFTNSSWKAFRLDTTIKDSAITFPALSPFGNQIDAGSRILKGGVYKGRWGQFDLWLYNDWFIDPFDNIEYPMITDGMVIMSGADLMGTRAFAAILDEDFNYGEMAYAPKTWVEKNPSQRFVMTQSSPLVIPSRVNSSFCAKVV